MNSLNGDLEKKPEVVVIKRKKIGTKNRDILLHQIKPKELKQLYRKIPKLQLSLDKSYNRLNEEIK